MGKNAADLTDGSVSGLHEIWEAVRARADGDRGRTASACVEALKGQRGATWVKERYAVFSAFRQHGIREIAPSEGYAPSQAQRNRGVYAPSEVRRWLGTYARRLDDEDLRSLVTWHLRWVNEATPERPVQPASSPHLAGLLRASTRVTTTLDLQEPMRIVAEYIGNLGKAEPSVDITEFEGPDPAIAQLRSHVPDEGLWNGREQLRAAIEEYRLKMRRCAARLEEEARKRTGLHPGYGCSGGSSWDPGSPPTLMDGFLFALFEHAFALLDGQAPRGLRSRVIPTSTNPRGPFKLEAGWAALGPAAVGDLETVERVRLDEKDMQFLFMEGAEATFMDNDSFEQIVVTRELIGDPADFLKDDMVCKIMLYEGTPLSVEIPPSVVMQVVEADPVVRGQTASSSYKPGKLENGRRVMIPPFIEAGTRIVVNTADASYVERAKD